MNNGCKCRALLAALLGFALPAGAAPQADDKAFNEQAQVIQDGMQVLEDAGLFGRPGERPGSEGPRASAVGDRDLDRYVQRLGFEIRMRNELADRNPDGFR